MSKKTMSVRLKRTKGAQFVAEGAAGQRALIDGPQDIGGQGEGVRPMEMLLMALAGCSAMDVVLILNKQRQDLVDLEIGVEGTRKDETPAVYEHIHLVFDAKGVDGEKLARAVSLSMEKYCSVTRMLEPTVKITTEARADGVVVGRTEQGGDHG